jgi:hypothetical protein
VDIQKASSSGSGSQSKFPIKKSRVLLQESYISSGKQGGGATVLWKGHDIVAGETCVPTALNINNLRKAAMLLHFQSCCGYKCFSSLSACRILLSFLCNRGHELVLFVLIIGLCFSVDF